MEYAENYVEKRLEMVVSSLDVKIDKGQEIEYFTKLKENSHVAPKKVICREFTPKGNSIRIVPIADPHLGHINCNLEKLMQYLSYIDKCEDCYTVLLGDQAETATRQSIGMAMFDEDIHLEHQMAALEKILTPLAMKNKILGIVPGNHELRVAQLIGINPIKELAQKLDIEYLGFQGFLQLKVGPNEYHVMVHHGAGGGSSTGSKVNSVEKLGRIAMADLYLTGHTHIRHVTEDFVYEIKNGDLVARKRYYVTCGSFLEYFRGYPEMKGLTPAATGGVCIELRADDKNIHVIM